VITDQQASIVIEAAIAEARRMNRKITAAVVDTSGYLVSLRRMDGAGFLTPEIAEAKAFTSAAWNVPTNTIAERARAKMETYQAFAGIGRRRIVPGQGGRPITRDNVSIGALGISGGSGDEDEAICIKALNALMA
jgi:uncharacterized protein GlcG (DUF336 family)